jgi:threonine synthase
MELVNLKVNEERVSFSQAVRQGLGKNQGLFFPTSLPVLENVDDLLAQDFVARSALILSKIIGDELSEETVLAMVDGAFQFPAPVQLVTERIAALELFHGPTLAFKDFGGRFMAQSLAQVRGENEKITILTATSGDTGAAVAHAFFGMENIEVVILYPKGKISPLQEKMFCTLGGNIRTLSVDGTFDDCQALVKAAFDDEELKVAIGLNSANSINISRLLAQVCYYFEAFAQLPKAQRDNVVVSVPSGNFGNLTAGLLAKALGLPIKRFVAATNENDTVPRYLQTGKWQPNTTIATLSNAMDVSEPNNWPRVEAICASFGWPLSLISGMKVSENESIQSVKALASRNYLCEPHGAIAYHALESLLIEDEVGIFLCTAHPAKFKESVDAILETDIDLPAPLAKHAKLPLLSEDCPADFSVLRRYLFDHSFK